MNTREKRYFGVGVLLLLTLFLCSSVLAQSGTGTVELVLSVDKTQASLGDTIVYSLALTNTGSSEVNNITVKDNLISPEVSFVSCTDSCTRDSYQTYVQWIIASLAVGETKNLSFTMKVADTAYPSTQYIDIGNEADYCVGPWNPSAYQTSNHVNTRVDLPKVADMMVQKYLVEDGTIVKAGSDLHYSFIIMNQGNTDVTNFKIQDVLPSSLTVDPSSLPAECSLDTAANTLNCLYPLVAYGSGITPDPSFTAKIQEGYSGMIENSAKYNNGDASPELSKTTITTRVESVLQEPPDVAVAMTVDKTEAYPGDLLNYEITLTNNGGPARNVAVRGEIPMGTHYVKSDGTSFLGSNFGNKYIQWNIPNMAENESVVLHLTVGIDSDAYSDVYGMVDVDNGHPAPLTAADPAPWGNYADVQTELKCVDMYLSLSQSAQTVQPGGSLTYDVRLTNTGSISAQNVLVRNYIPAGTAFGTCDNNCQSGSDADGGFIQWVIPQLETGYDHQFHSIFTVNINSDAAGEIRNAVRYDKGSTAARTLTDPAPEYISYDVSAKVLVPGSPLISGNANLGNNQVSPVEPGDTVEYAFLVESQNNVDAEHITLRCYIPANMHLPAAGGTAVSDLPFITGTSADGRAFIQWDVPSILQYEFQFIKLFLEVDPAAPNGDIDISFLYDNGNTSALTAAAPDPKMNSGHTFVSVYGRSAGAELILTQKSSAAEIMAGKTLTFTLEAENIGFGAASGVKVVDTLPSGLTFVSCGGGVSCSESGGVVTWDLGNMAAFSFVPLDLITSVNPAFSGTLTNTASIQEGAKTPIQSESKIVKVTPRVASPEVVVLKSVDKSTARPGDVVTYTLTLSNSGEMDASNVTVRDHLPTGLTVGTLPSECHVVSGTAYIQCNIPQIAAGQTGLSLSFTANVNTDYIGTISNDVSYDNGNNAVQPDAAVDLGKTSNQAVTVVSSQPTPVSANVTVEKAVDRASAVSGDTLTYTLTLKNNGTGDASNVTVRDNLPTGLTLGTLPSECHAVSGSRYIQCNVALVAAGETGKTLNFTAVIDSNFTGTISNSASYDNGNASVQPDAAADLAKRSAVAATTVSARPTPVGPNVTVEKTVDQLSAISGGSLSYTLTLKNDGTGDALNVTARDDLPTGLTAGTLPAECHVVSGSSFIQCNVPTVAAGETGQLITFTADIASDFVGTIKNTISYDNGNASPLPDAATDLPRKYDATADTVVTASPEPLISGIKAVDLANAKPGDILTYTITVRNNGTADANNVTLRDVLPVELTVGTLPAECHVVSGSNGIQCNLPSLLKGTSTDLVFTALIDPIFEGTISNYATLDNGNPAPIADDTADLSIRTGSVETVVVAPKPNVTMVKSVDKTEYGDGDILTYSLTLNNSGDADAMNVTVRDYLPMGTVLDQNDPSCQAAADGSFIQCNASNLSALTGTQTFAFSVSVQNAAGYIMNTALFDEGNPAPLSLTDPDPLKNSNRVSVRPKQVYTAPEFYWIGENCVGRCYNDLESRLCNGGLPATGITGSARQALSAVDASLNFGATRMHIEIPSLDQSRDILSVPFENGVYDVSELGANVGLLELSSLPGEGLSVLSAHNHLGNIEVGPFVLIHTMNIGDRIFVTSSDGKLMVFSVYDNYLVDKNADQVLADRVNGHRNPLVLVTCENESIDGGYANRRLILAEQISD